MTSTTVAAPAPRGFSVRSSLKRNRRWALITSYVFLIIFAIFFLLPPYYMIVTALKSDAEVAHMTANPWIIANGITLDQFRLLFKETDFLIFFKNTAIVTVLAATTVTISSAMVAWGFAYFRFRGRGALFALVLASMMLPGAVTMIPTFLIWNSLGFVGTLVPMWAQNFFASASQTGARCGNQAGV